MFRAKRTGFSAALANREFRALWAAEAQSVVGDQLAKVALAVVVYRRTGSVGLTALSYAAMLLPALVTGPLMSGFADVYPRRTLMVMCASMQAVLVALMALPSTPISALFALIIAVQFAQAPFMAAQAAVLPVILSGEAYQAAQALRQMTRQVGALGGLAFGGMAVGLLDVSGALLLDALTFALAAVAIQVGLHHRPAAAVESGGHGGSGLRLGAALIWQDPRLRALLGLSWLAGFAVVPEGLMVPFAVSIGSGPSAVGWLLAVESAAMVAGAYLLAQFVSQDTRLRLLGPLAILTLLPLLGYASHPGLTAALVLLGLSGFFAAYQVTTTATFMELVPNERRGQAYGVARSGLIAVQGLGVLAGGAVAELTGSVSGTITLAGALGLVAAVPAAIAWHHANHPHRAPVAAIAAPAP